MPTIMMLLISSAVLWITCRVWDRKNPEKPKRVEERYPEPKRREVEHQ